MAVKKHPENLFVKRSFSMSAPQSQWLDSEAAELGMPASEIIRRALDRERERREFLVPRQGRSRKGQVETTGQVEFPLHVEIVRKQIAA